MRKQSQPAAGTAAAADKYAHGKSSAPCCSKNSALPAIVVNVSGIPPRNACANNHPTSSPSPLRICKISAARSSTPAFATFAD